MIIGDIKALEEIEASIRHREKVLVLGCRGCVTICQVGGEKEVSLLASQLRIADKVSGKQRVVEELSIERQCDAEYIEPIVRKIKEFEVVVSLACGIGVQFVAELGLPTQVVPGINTTFLGANLGDGRWVERCQACGDCVLEITGGVCPIARCSKSLFNGPCGGSDDGQCEIDPETACAWQLIYDRLKSLGKLENLKKVIPARNWSVSRDGGPRTRIREDLRK
jgi:ferredoxin